MENSRIPTSDVPAEPRSVRISSAALARLMEEVRNNADSQPTAYNRMHNRHNR